MKNVKENILMQDMSIEEMMNVNGGANYIWSDNCNELVYFGIALYNAGVSVYNWITGEEAGVKKL